METVLFYILASAAMVAAVAVITRGSPLMSAVWLVICLMCVAGIFALLNSPFLAVLQVLISAGAVMVIFIFVVMLVDLGEEAHRARAINFAKALGAIAAGYLGFILILSIARPPYVSPPASGEAFEAPLTLAGLLLGSYAVPFELAGVLLLVAAVAAVVLAKKKTEHKIPLLCKEGLGEVDHGLPHPTSPYKGEEGRAP
ncbi:MAG: NADH-quinone oxidoreductase subunit J [Pseudomonadota bacterium]